MTDVQEAQRQELVAKLISRWTNEDGGLGKRLWGIVVDVMEFVGSYKGFDGSDKKELAMQTLREILAQTDSPGPDFIVDPAVMWVVEHGIDYLYAAAKGRFNFDG